MSKKKRAAGSSTVLDFKKPKNSIAIPKTDNRMMDSILADGQLEYYSS
jgi:hypothetical protein